MEFEEFVRLRYAALVRSAYLLTGSGDVAEDLVQDTLVRAGARWSRILSGGAPEPYVRRMLYTQAIDNWRRLRRDAAGSVVSGPRADADLPPQNIDETASTAHVVATRVDLARALARLTPKQRAVLVLRYVEDLSEAATAQVLGIAVGTVKSQTRDALARLRVVAPELLESAKEET